MRCRPSVTCFTEGAAPLVRGRCPSAFRTGRMLIPMATACPPHNMAMGAAPCLARCGRFFPSFSSPANFVAAILILICEPYGFSSSRPAH